MGRVALILLVAGILGLLLFLATRTNESRVRALAPVPNAGVAETHPGPEAPAPSSDRTAVSPLDESTPSDVAGWRVCVVDGRTDAPVAGATVSVIDMTAISRETIERGIGFDTIEGLRLRRERALEAQTGADGCARFAAPPERAMVEARSGADWAIAEWSKD